MYWRGARDRSDLAWTAGLFEGEGCITDASPKTTKVVHPILQLKMTDEDVVRRFRDIVGHGVVRIENHRKSHWKTIWRVRITGHEIVQATIAAFWPWLGRRWRERAVEVLRAYKDSNPHPGKGRPAQELCKRGHPRSGDNLYVSPKGKRNCRLCLEHQRKYRRKSRSNKETGNEVLA